MQKITLPENPVIIKKEGNLAVFEIRSCCPGYGTTLGNSLRRVLLSSLEGAAITSIKVRGINHEFSNIPGIVEDVVEIILNLKNIKFKMYNNEPVKLTLKVNEEKEVKASDIKTTSDVDVVNKNAHIATISKCGKKCKLDMEMKVEKGIGYASIDQRNDEKLEIGTIAIDAIFTPIKKANFKVESMRVGRMINYDKLILEIETDGSITPEEALNKASKILVDHFSLFEKCFRKESPSDRFLKEVKADNNKMKSEEDSEGKTSENVEIDKEVNKEDVKKTSIESIGLSQRTSNILKENKIKTVAKLVKKTEDDLKEFSGMGDKGIKEIKKGLNKLGLSLKE